MKRLVVEGTALEYEVVGGGEPVVTIHGALLADAFRPLLAEPTLTSRYRLVLYHRRGYEGSSGTSGPVSIERQAADCHALLQHLGIESAHIVGHSYGGTVALQMAVDTPRVVRSLALLEPAFFSRSTAAGYREALAKGRQRYREVGAEVTLHEFLTPRFGSGYRSLLEQRLPGAFAQAVVDAHTFFEHEIPGLSSWSFGEDELQRVTQPTLVVLGEKSDALWPRFGETHAHLLESLADAEGFVVPGGSHALHVENPSALATGLASFWQRH